MLLYNYIAALGQTLSARGGLKTMRRYFLLAVAVLITATGCDLFESPETPSTAMLNRLELLKDARLLDYAAAKSFLGVPLSTFRFHAIANGDKITSRSGEYRAKSSNAYPPEFTNISFDMAWEAESNRPSTQSWHTKKGLRSSLRLSFNKKLICISKPLLILEWGSGRQGGITHGDDTTINYGDLDDVLVSFTFNTSGCADSVDIIANNPKASWTTPEDASAGDAEFVTKLVPLDKSGKQLLSLGMECGPEGSPGNPEDTSCGCDRQKQTKAGPCHHAVTLSTLKEGGLGIRVFPLLNAEAN